MNKATRAPSHSSEKKRPVLPSSGGSYVRQPDGSLKRAEKPSVESSSKEE